ncbi:interferon-induced helicase C domain-containing protein 1-like [Dreissena polymorpha]|nr:interferon-induced helicase C domain-containing protein 1-like [Dreissena polymorpha]
MIATDIDINENNLVDMKPSLELMRLFPVFAQFRDEIRVLLETYAKEVDKDPRSLPDKELGTKELLTAFERYMYMKGKEDNDVELFEYQKELAREGCEGESVVIMAPTNSGKTYVGSRIMQVHLRRQKAQALLAKVIFVVENEALAFQQGKLFAKKLPAYRTKVFTGSVQRDKQQYLWDFLASRDIFVVTAQVLVNALKTGQIQSLTQFSLIVFDECHHSNQQHRYNEILWKYIEMKLQPGTDVAGLPQKRMMFSECFDDEPENPKLVKMGQILQDVLVADNTSRGIISVKTRELAKALVSWINETDNLKILHASEFVGQNVATSKGSMTKCKQKDALEYFKGGRHKVIIATSVAEEGLDIRKCNLVIRYEHVTNEIVRRQSIGRVRTDFSRYLVISEEGSWILDKEEENHRCEELMNPIVPHLQAFIDDRVNLWENELLTIQTEMKEERDREKERRRLNMVNQVQFQCLNCSAFICRSDDIKCIMGVHHIITDPDADERLRLERDAPYFVEPEGLEYGGQVYCANVSCQLKLGVICTFFKYKYIDFPLISLKAFRVVNPDGTGKSYKVWKNVPCKIADFTFDDLRDV